MSVQRAQYEITSSDFIDWIVYLDEKEKIPTRQDILLGNIALECRRSYIKHPWLTKLDEFLQVFEIRKPKKQNWKEKMNLAKGFFGNLFSTYKGKR